MCVWRGGGGGGGGGRALTRRQKKRKKNVRCQYSQWIERQIDTVEVQGVNPGCSNVMEVLDIT